MSSKNLLMMAGAFLIIIGVLGLAIPVLTTQKTQDIVKVGDLNLQTTTDNSYRIPLFLSGGVLTLGAILLAAGLSRSRM